MSAVDQHMKAMSAVDQRMKALAAVSGAAASVESPASVPGKQIRYVGLTKRYGSVVALQPTNLTIEAGEFFAIIGPSGSGKTTLLGLTVGYLAADEGEILVDGHNIEGVPPFKRNFGMVFQNYSLFPHKTVAQNIGFPLLMRGMAKEEVARKVAGALRLVRLDTFGDRYPSALSGGQQQRVALARASVYNPLLLVMDEPLSALDKNLREEMQFEIKQLQGKLGSTVLYVTHDQGEASAMATRIAIMRSGSIVQIGSAKELYRNPKNRFVASFLGQANIFEVTGTQEAAKDPIVTTTSGVALKVASMPAGTSQLCACVRPEAISISATRPELDNVIRGTVVDSTFTNGVQRHRVSVASGTTLEQWQQMTGDPFSPEPGSEVYLGWQARETIIVRAE
ncbi:ABC transporter ATP-binding protein [Mesorhizobium sp. B3-1-3]|uniref:ABC transporter ATP-binding protein n=1 Tax=unclassified Mesorhizobium TaxID=325217 RepID=UPI001126C702|nr:MULTISPECIES: ABC transporter ATP-binding protein [unclassified Mesorhizobium]TPI57350.1 ABC transporter ATP-binding protein [Mesorhizobium sp. B3-1-8]TPI63503.1 ABC transporter ATP-binding protein [Mesorhizobium sp. B3-1-3]